MHAATVWLDFGFDLHRARQAEEDLAVTRSLLDTAQEMLDASIARALTAEAAFASAKAEWAECTANLDCACGHRTPPSQAQ